MTSRLNDMAHEMSFIDQELGMPLWEDWTPSMRNRFRRYARASVEALRNPHSKQVERVRKRFPDLPHTVIRQVWKDMIDSILNERDIYV